MIKQPIKSQTCQICLPQIFLSGDKEAIIHVVSLMIS